MAHLSDAALLLFLGNALLIPESYLRCFCYVLFSWAVVTYLSLTRRMSWWNRSTCSKLALSVTEKTMRNPSPVLIYCSLIALNSSWPAVSSTMKMEGHRCITWMGLFHTFFFKNTPMIYVFYMGIEHTVGLLCNLVWL